MGFFEDVLKSALPNSQSAEPIAIAVGSLILGRVLGGGAAAAPAGQAAPQPANTGDLAGTLGGLIGKLQQAGLGDAVNSWIGTGPNAQVAPGQLGGALGQEVIQSLAKHTGLSEQQLLAGLTTVLPVVIDKLTPHGRLPTPGEAPHVA